MENYFEDQFSNHEFYQCKAGVIPNLNLHSAQLKSKHIMESNLCSETPDHKSEDISPEKEKKLNKVNINSAIPQFVLVEESENNIKMKSELSDLDNKLNNYDNINIYQITEPELQLQDVIMKDEELEIEAQIENELIIKTEFEDLETEINNLSTENNPMITEPEFHNFEEVDENQDFETEISVTESNSIKYNLNPLNIPEVSRCVIPYPKIQENEFINNLKRKLPTSFKETEQNIKAPSILRKSTLKDTAIKNQDITNQILLHKNMTQDTRTIFHKSSRKQTHTLIQNEPAIEKKYLVYVPRKIYDNKKQSINPTLIQQNSTVSMPPGITNNYIHLSTTQQTTEKILFVAPQTSNNSRVIIKNPKEIHNSTRLLYVLPPRVKNSSECHPNNTQNPILLSSSMMSEINKKLQNPPIIRMPQNNERVNSNDPRKLTVTVEQSNNVPSMTVKSSDTVKLQKLNETITKKYHKQPPKQKETPKQKVNPISPKLNCKHESTNTIKIRTNNKLINTQLLDADQIQYCIDTKLLNETLSCIKTEPLSQEINEKSPEVEKTIQEMSETISAQEEKSPEAEKNVQEMSETISAQEEEEEDESEKFKQLCIKVTRQIHDTHFCKYLGIIKTHKWVVECLQKDLIKLKDNKKYILEYRDIIELVLRKINLNEEYYILGDCYGISDLDTEKLYDEFSTFIINALESIGMRVGLLFNKNGFYIR